MGGLKNLLEKNYEVDDVITTQYSDVINLSGYKSISVQSIIDVDTPAAKASPYTDVDTTEDTITEVGHGFVTGLKGQFTTDDTLPTGISALTDYFIIVVDVDTYKVATTLANALAGTNVDITAQGAGNHTFTPTALAGATLTYEKSNDGTNYDAIASATSITADAHEWFEKEEPTYKYLRLKYTLTAGKLSSDNHVYAEGKV